MFQADLDGGFGGALKDAGGAFLTNIAGQLSGNKTPERVPDQNQPTDIQGAPTNTQKAEAGNAAALLSNPRNLLIGGGVILALAAVLMSRK